MKNLETIANEMQTLLRKAQKFINVFLTNYKDGKVTFSPSPYNITFINEPASHDRLKTALQPNLDALAHNLKELESILQLLNQGIFRIGPYVQFQNIAKDTSQLLSQFGFYSSSCAEETKIYTDPASNYVFNKLEGYRSKFDRLSRRLLKNFKFSQLRFVDVTLADEAHFDNLLTGMQDNNCVQAIQLSVSLMPYEILLEEEFIDMVMSAEQLFSFEIMGGYFPDDDDLTKFIETLSAQLNRLQNRSFFMRVANRNAQQNLYLLKEAHKETIYVIYPALEETLPLTEIFKQSRSVIRLANLSRLDESSLKEVCEQALYPIDYAVMNNDLLALRYLMARGANYSGMRNDMQGYTTALHLAAAYANTEVLAQLLHLSHIPLRVEDKKTVMADFLENTEQHTPLEIAVLRDNIQIAEVLIDQFFAQLKPNLINMAFEKEHFDVLCFLINRGTYIDEVVREVFYALTQSQDNHPLKAFLLGRLAPFKLVSKRNVKDLETWYADNKIDDINTWLDFENHSLLYSAIEAKHNDMYGYLISVGAKLTNDEEYELADSKFILGAEAEAAIAKYLPETNDRLAAYLLSCTHLRNLPNDADKINLYEIYLSFLNNPLISPILPVLQYAEPKLSIIIDMTYENTKYVYNSADPNHGVLHKPSHSIYVANTGKKNWQGTLIHEMTHLACKLVYDNDTLPYKAGSPYERTMNTIYDNFHDTRRDAPFKNGPDALRFFRDMFKSYDSGPKQIKESIVRVPQTLFMYGDTGQAVLEAHAAELFTYYIDVFLKDCQQYTITQREQQRNLTMAQAAEGSTAEGAAASLSPLLTMGLLAAPATASTDQQPAATGAPPPSMT